MLAQFQQALQQTLANVGYAAADGKGKLDLKVRVVEALAARFSNEVGGIPYGKSLRMEILEL